MGWQSDGSSSFYKGVTGSSNYDIPASGAWVRAWFGRLNTYSGAGKQSILALNYSGAALSPSFELSCYGHAAGYPSAASQIQITGNTHSNTTIDTLSSTAGLYVGMIVSGTGIPANTTITAVNVAGSSITISNAATTTATAVSLTIGIGGRVEINVRSGTGSLWNAYTRSANLQDGQDRWYFFGRNTTSGNLELWTCLPGDGHAPVLEATIQASFWSSAASFSAYAFHMGAYTSEATTSFMQAGNRFYQTWGVNAYFPTLADMKRLANGAAIDTDLGKTVAFGFRAIDATQSTITSFGAGAEVLTKQGTPTAVSDPSAPSVGSLAVVDFENRQLFGVPLSGGNATITCQFNFTGSPAGIDYQIIDQTNSGAILRDWTTAVTSPSGGTVSQGALGSFTFTLPDAGGHFYTINLRFSDNHAITSSGSNQWTTGILFRNISQSEGEFMAEDFLLGSVPSGAATPDARACLYSYGHWAGANDRMQFCGAVEFLNSVAAATGRSVAWASSAVGGTSISTWITTGSGGVNLPGAWCDFIKNGGYDTFLNWGGQGSQDVGNATYGTRTGYKTNFGTLDTAISALWGSNIGQRVLEFWGNKSVFSSGFHHDTVAAMRGAYYDIAAAFPAWMVAGYEPDITRRTGDTLHPDGPGQKTKGHRLGITVLKALGTVAYSAKGPAVLGINWLSTTSADIYYQHEAGSALAIGFSGSNVSDILVWPSGGPSANSYGTTATFSNGSPTLTVANATGIAVGQYVACTAVPAGTTVTAVSGTTITISANTTAANNSFNAGVCFLNLSPVQVSAAVIHSSNTVRITLSGARSGSEVVTIGWGLFSDVMGSGFNPYPGNGAFTGVYDNSDSAYWTAHSLTQPNGQGGLPAQLAPDGLSAYSPPTTPAPTVTGVTSTSGSTAGGTLVTIAGSAFTGATGVSFGATAAASFTVVSDTQITAVTPAHAAGTVDVTVTTPYGTSALGPADYFTFNAPGTQSLLTVSRVDCFTFSTITANGNPPAPASALLMPINTMVTLGASGTFGSGTLTTEITLDGGTTWIPGPAVATLSAAGSITFQLCATGIRPKLTGATSPSITAQMAFASLS